MRRLMGALVNRLSYVLTATVCALTSLYHSVTRVLLEQEEYQPPDAARARSEASTRGTNVQFWSFLSHHGWLAAQCSLGLLHSA
jgi:hypothetical protein